MKPLTKRLIALVVFVLIGVVFIKPPSPPDDEEVVVVTPPEPIKISIVAALPVEPWVSQAAEVYNSEARMVEGREIIVEIIPMDGLSARHKWENEGFDRVPTVWVPESRVWVDQANVAVVERTGRDIFLAGGPYRTQPVVLSPMVWGIWDEAYKTLVEHFGTEQISWDQIYEAAVIGEWSKLGEKENTGKFKLVIPHPKRDPAGLTAIVGAGAEHFDKSTVSTQELQDSEFLDWLSELFDTVVDFSPAAAEDMLLFGRSNGDAGQIVESYLLSNMDGIVTRWGHSLQIVYPDPIAWFDFPYAIYMGPETSTEEKQAALDFKNYLLTTDQQAAALEFGLRTVCAECPTSGGLISKWKDVGVAEIIPSDSRMGSASRSGLDALTKSFVEKYEE